VNGGKGRVRRETGGVKGGGGGKTGNGGVTIGFGLVLPIPHQPSTKYLPSKD